MMYPFKHFFTKRQTDNQYVSEWADSFMQEINRILHHFKHWINFPQEKLQGGEFHWKEQYQWAQDLLKQHPTFQQDLTALAQFLGDMEQNSLQNPKNPANYPLFVSLYDVTRRLGGHEEGGWWYDSEYLVNSVKVNNYQEVRQAAMRYLRTLGQADLNGKPIIVLEKTKGQRGNRPPPTYS